MLLCDEPTSALDVSLAASVLNLIGGLRRELGMAVLFVTHDLSVARVVADRIAVMYLGRIVEIGPADEIVHSPAHPYTQALVSAVPELGRAARRAAGRTGQPAGPAAAAARSTRAARSPSSSTSTRPWSPAGDGSAPGGVHPGIRTAGRLHRRKAS